MNAHRRAGGAGRVRSRAVAGRFTGRFGYLRRADWGAQEGHRFDADGHEIHPPTFFPLQTLTVHLLAADAESDPAGAVGAVGAVGTVYRAALERGLGDLGFHLLIDPRGGVYQGRWSGPDAGPAFGPRRRQERPQLVTGAHVDGFDPGNAGVTVLTDQTLEPAGPAQLALVRVLASLVHATEVDPVGATDYLNPVSGATRTVPTICGPAHWTGSAGEVTHPSLAQVRTEVAALLLG